MPAITLPCSSNAAWEVVVAILFLGGDDTQYSVFSSANHRYAPSVMAMNDGSYNPSFYKFYNLHYWLHI